VILLDTNVVSELMKKPAHAAVVAWFQEHEAVTFLCAPSLAEIAFGITRLPAGKRRSGLEGDFADFRIRYAARTLGFSAVSAMIYADIMHDALKAQHNMTVMDGQIAAIATEHSMKLATRNIKDFKTTAVALINPWDAQ
jgi:predicted nucleic acid-binding protein